MTLDAHARSPEPLRLLFKKWQKSSREDIDLSNEIIDFSRPEQRTKPELYRSTEICGEQRTRAFEKFLPTHSLGQARHTDSHFFKFELSTLPGLFVYPSLITSDVQIVLLDKLLHRDLSNASYKSNLHLHYHVPYPEAKVDNDNEDDDESGDKVKSFFLSDQSSILSPKDTSVHKPLTVKQMLNRKLRWMTLGGQYDWTAKVYPAEVPPQFPEDIACLLKGLFPDIDAQAAIVNFYTPGDTLSVHRDVSEECDSGLISISIGCDGLFIIGNEDGSQAATIRLKSGDVILMSEQSRYAWHAVPKVLADTCPSWLQAWPATNNGSALNIWKDWMANKRINLNVRQMRA